MEAFYEVLGQLYQKVLAGAPLDRAVQDYAFYLNPAFSDPLCSISPSFEWSNSEHTQGNHKLSPVMLTAIPAPPACVESLAQEVMLLQLTVIKMIITRTASLRTETNAKEKYRDVIRMLLQSAEIDSKIICMLQSPDKLLSHMAAQCLAMLLYFQLREKIPLSNSWITFCQKTLSEYPESGAVLHCLWTLTAVIKEVFKDTCPQKTEILKQFLTPFDTTLEVFYSSLLSQHFENCQEPSEIINSLICFLELLELLIASRSFQELHLRSQRIVFLKPCVINVLTWPVQAFVKRKLIMFIKKCLIRKVGEDLCRGPVPASVAPDSLLDMDTLALAKAVLQAVHLGLLKTFSVPGKRSCFGGDEIQPGCRHTSGPDHVILRAASLLTVKSLEIKFQNCTSANEMRADLQRFMSKLLAFLKPQLQPGLQERNPCEWLSRVFIEQDDDMLEAAKASLGIYLKLTRDFDATESLTQEKETWTHHTHENGYNPHCVFLFFFRSIGFDCTVLLDFLISSETCFLEYFVRYLKLLQKDWDHFFTVCKFFDASEYQHGINNHGQFPSGVQDKSTKQTAPHCLSASQNHSNVCSGVLRPSDDCPELLAEAVTAKRTHPRTDYPLPPSQASRSLVAYDSSDDSEAESTDQCIAHNEPISVLQEAVMKIQDSTGNSRDPNELSLQPQSALLVLKGSSFPSSLDHELSPDNTVLEVGIFHRIVRCFEELQHAIYRLQKRNLFPYNPAALLRLLKHIEDMYNKV
ncbi:protein Lines homolog 1 isoform X2 [Perognathus longimembris pacificus]|nr:protein Lines homolog 1 isoform X2 [Perognathus longimembris pacificus]XP_048185419.1 protein Lines homolog 1 isoform X2 [Perognathus longimembris pacificus]XP_048185421.1 protein Lines homolog 1 isoform X2 [Perognathus longimembris pacificus]